MKQCLSRRNFLISSAGLCLAGMTRCQKKRPCTQFKIGACDWTLSMMADPQVLKLAEKLGLDGVQISLGTVENDMHLRKPEIQQTYLALSEQTGVAIPSLAIGPMNDVPYKSDPMAEQWLLDAIDVCEAMSIPIILIPFFVKGDLRGDEAGKKQVIQRLKKASEKAEKKGVVIGLESWLSAEEHAKIIDGVGSPAVKVYYDVGNSHKAGYDIYQEIRDLGDAICQVHAKDYEDLYGKGSIDFIRVKAALDEINYAPWLVMEGVKMPLGLEESIQYDAAYLRSVFNM